LIADAGVCEEEVGGVYACPGKAVDFFSILQFAVFLAHDIAKRRREDQ
jgi:hypothetical protein